MYYTIVEGSFRAQVPQDHPDAVRRDWKATDGTRGTKYERIVNAVIGYIEDIQFRDSEYGIQVYIVLDKNPDGTKPITALNTASREAEDFLKKLPNIQLMKEVRLRPFKFAGDEGDDVRGMEVLQADEWDKFKVKIANYFRGPDPESDNKEAKININGFPNPEGDTEDYSKDDWKMYFLTCRKFLITYTKEHMFAAVKQAVDDRLTTTPKSAEQEARMRAARDEAEDDANGLVHAEHKDIPF